MSAIVCQGLSKRYGKVTALDRLDLTVPEGSIFGFLGPNGAGKSTAIRILATLSHPTAGDAWIAGVIVTRARRAGAPRARATCRRSRPFPGGWRRRSFWSLPPRSAGCRPGSGARRAASVLDLVGLGDCRQTPHRRVFRRHERAAGYRPGADPPPGRGDPRRAGRPRWTRWAAATCWRIIAGLRGRPRPSSSPRTSWTTSIASAIRSPILAGARLMVQETTARLKERYAPADLSWSRWPAGAAPLADALAGQPWVTRAEPRRAQRARAGARRGPCRARAAAPGAGRRRTLLRYEQALPSLEDVFVRLVRPPCSGGGGMNGYRTLPGQRAAREPRTQRLLIAAAVFLIAGISGPVLTH